MYHCHVHITVKSCYVRSWPLTSRWSYHLAPQITWPKIGVQWSACYYINPRSVAINVSRSHWGVISGGLLTLYGRGEGLHGSNISQTTVTWLWLTLHVTCRVLHDWVSGLEARWVNQWLDGRLVLLSGSWVGEWLVGLAADHILGSNSKPYFTRYVSYQ